MYTLLVYTEGGSTLVGRHEIRQAAEVLAAIPDIMKKHPGCERVEVYLAAVRLFSVDCAGNTTAG